jgi:hypothetical protein
MKLSRMAMWAALALLGCGSWGLAQTGKTGKPVPATNTKEAKAPAAPEQQNQDANINAYVGLLRQDLRTKKALVIAEVMKFDDGEAAAFWPIYRGYETELAAMNDEKLAGIKFYAEHYETLTDDQADTLATKALDLEDRRNELKKKYYERFKKGLSATTAARFLQVENQLLMVSDLQIASRLPIVR